jgi:hypothetical protein
MRAGLIFVSVVLSVLVIAARPLPVQAASPNGQLVTLRAHDSLTAAWNDRTETYVTTINQGELDLGQATLVYDILQGGQLSFGFRLRERAKLVDVGDFRVAPLVRPRDIVPKAGVGVINTLRVQRNNIQYLAPVNRWLNLKEGDAVVGRLESEGVQHVEPELGHVYLLRYVFDGSERVVAFHVVEHVPGERVVLRIKNLTAS